MIIAKLASMDGVDKLLKAEAQVLCRHVLLYILRLEPAATLRNTIEPLIGKEEFAALKTWLDQTDYTLDIAKRAIAYMFLKQARLAWGSKKLLKRTVRKFNVAMDDMELAAQLLTNDDMEQMRANGTLIYERNPLIDKVLAHGRVIGFCRQLAWRKLRFLTENDPALGGIVKGKPDLTVWVQTLMAEAKRMALYYSHFTSELQLLNYVTRGIHNFAMRQIDFHTAEMRARIKRSDDPARVYDVPVASWTQEAEAEVDAKNANRESSRLEAREVLEQLAQTPEAGPLLRAISGKDLKFNAFLLNKNIDSAQMSEQELVHAAAVFTKTNLLKLRTWLHDNRDAA